MVIDSHAHIGHDYVSDDTVSEDELVSAMTKYGIDGAIVQPLINRPYMEDTVEIHDRIYNLCKKYKGKFWGMASINPHFKPEDYYLEAERCVKKLGFVGLKITPIGHAVNPSKADGMYVFEVARELGVPVMVHTGSGIPISDPMSVIDAAKSFRDVKIILAHAGSDLMAKQAVYLAAEFENVYLEPSWISILALSGMYKTLGAGKLMFSSDLPINIPVELAKYKALINDEKDLEQVFSGTVIGVFNLKDKKD